MMAERVPERFGKAGRALWRAVTGGFVLEEWERRLLVEACRVADRLDELEAEIGVSGVVGRDGKVSPALVEARNQQAILARLIASLRIPDAVGEVPQRRGAARGAYGLRAVD